MSSDSQGLLMLLFQESLGGNAITLMFALVSPVDKTHQENVNTMNLAQFAKAVKNKVKLNLVCNSLNFYWKIEKM